MCVCVCVCVCMCLSLRPYGRDTRRGEPLRGEVRGRGEPATNLTTPHPDEDTGVLGLYSGPLYIK